MGLELITPATTDLDLISLEEAKIHIRVDEALEDDYVSTLITAGREHTEDYLQRTILEATWRYEFDRFPVSALEPVLLPRPIASEIVGFTYRDTAGDTIELIEDTDFTFHKLIDLKSGIEILDSWPDTDVGINVIGIEFKAGWDPGDVPRKLRQAILVVIADMYENRQSDVYGMSVNATKAFEKLCSAWRVDSQ